MPTDAADGGRSRRAVDQFVGEALMIPLLMVMRDNANARVFDPVVAPGLNATRWPDPSIVATEGFEDVQLCTCSVMSLPTAPMSAWKSIVCGARILTLAGLRTSWIGCPCRATQRHTDKKNGQDAASFHPASFTRIHVQLFETSGTRVRFHLRSSVSGGCPERRGGCLEQPVRDYRNWSRRGSESQIGCR